MHATSDILAPGDGRETRKMGQKDAVTNRPTPQGQDAHNQRCPSNSAHMGGSNGLRHLYVKIKVRFMDDWVRSLGPTRTFSPRRQIPDSPAPAIA
jgi:hypothetical protein